MQLELFHMPKTEMQLLADEQIALKVSMKNLRMGVFKRVTEQSKRIDKLEAENQEFRCQFAIVMKAMQQYYDNEQNSIQ
jgi:hypothetical protein